MDPKAVEGLRNRGQVVAAALAEFRAKRQALGDSGKFTRQGLEDAIGEIAAATAGIIRRTMDDSSLRDKIGQHKQRLATTTKADPTTELVNFWKRMELRSLYDRQGLTIIDPATGSMRIDRLKADQFYRDALAKGDALAMEALEEWPTGSPVDAALVQQGQAQRLKALDPVVAQKLEGLEVLEDAMQNTLRDGLNELPKVIDDLIARQAGPAPAPEAA